MAIRTLLPDELILAKTVFQNSILYSKVRLQDDLGMGGIPWTSPPIAVFPYYVLHVGSYYQHMTTTNYRRKLLIHELTHVWQGQHGVPKGYVLNSAYHQSLSGITNGGDVAPAYSYTTGLKWAQYNCEQQASIVEDWFSNGSSSSDSRYVYITTNIRPGNPWA